MLALPMVLLSIAAFISVHRIARGPTNADRIIAGDVFGVAMCLLLILVSVSRESLMILDVVIAYAILLFADVLLLAKFMEKGEIHL